MNPMFIFCRFLWVVCGSVHAVVVSPLEGSPAKKPEFLQGQDSRSTEPTLPLI